MLNDARFKKAASIIGIIAGLGVIYFLVVNSTSTSGMTIYKAQFDNVTGLVEQAGVNLHGAEVGRVSSIELDPTDQTKALVELAIDPDIELMSDARVTLRIKSLLGEQFVDLETGTSTQPLVGDTIPEAASDLSLDDLLHTIGGLLGDVKDSQQVFGIVSTLTNSFEGRSEDLEVVLESSEILLEDLVERSSTLGNILDTVDQLTTGLDSSAGNIGETIRIGNTQINDLRTVLDENITTIDGTIANLENAIDSVDLQGTENVLANLEADRQKVAFLTDLLAGMAAGDRLLAAWLVSGPADPHVDDKFDKGMERFFTTVSRWRIPGLADQWIRTIRSWNLLPGVPDENTQEGQSPSEPDGNTGDRPGWEQCIADPCDIGL